MDPSACACGGISASASGVGVGSYDSRLRAWTSRHDTEAVHLPALLQRFAFRVIGRTDRLGYGDYDAGAVLHLCTGMVDISNVWTVSEGLDWAELVAAAAATFPGRALIGYERGGPRGCEDSRIRNFRTATGLGPLTAVTADGYGPSPPVASLSRSRGA